MAFFEHQGEAYLWTALRAAAQREDFESVQYWTSQILIHRSRARARKPPHNVL